MTKRNKSYPGFQIGTSLILVILTTLCLVVFAVLSLSTALRDYEYSRQVAEQTTDFYAANSKAYDLLEQIETTEDFSQIPELTVTEADSDTQIVSYEVPMGEKHALEVSVEITDGQSRIIEWKKASRIIWENNITLPVLGSD